MIQIKISIDAAVSLLLERMNYEFTIRQKNNLVPKVNRLEDLRFTDLRSIAETSALDLVFLLPVEVLIQDSNLTEILHKSFISLGKFLNKEEFNIYPKKRIEFLLKPVKTTFRLIEDEKSYKD